MSTHEIPDSLKYTRDHEWANIEGDTVTFGISDFAQSSLGDVVFLELPAVGSTLKQGDACGVIESIKSVSDLCTPMSGTVEEINQEAVDNPALCNTSPYMTWLVKLHITAPQEADKLLDAQQYEAHCAQEHHE